MRMMLLSVVLGTLTLVAAPAAQGGSETPPEGPPWKRDLEEAQREALQRNSPIFLYFTKTY